MKKIAKFLLIGLSVLFAFSCDVGLGPAVDLSAPVVEITKPEVAETVPQTITIEGNATDNIDVTSIKVTIEETKQSYQLIPGSAWQVLVNGNWQNYDNGISSIENKTVKFTLVVNVANSKSGDDITIITQAYDEMGNEGKQSKDERLVTIDIKEPVVSVNEPTLFTNYSIAETNKNTYTLLDNSILSKLYNQTVSVSGYQKEESKLERLAIYIDTETDDTIDPDEEVFKAAINSKIAAGNQDAFLFAKEMTGAGLRNWNFELKKSDLPATIQTGPHLLRISSYSYDVAGNCEAKVHGWFVYWNEADVPWMDVNFGYDSFSAQGFEKVAASKQLLGQAFDDDGLKTISIKTYRGNNVDDLSHPEPYPLTRDINLDEEGNPKYYSWSTYAIQDLSPFFVIVKCIDINGVESESIRKCLDVEDESKPLISITSSAELPKNKTKFSISGTVEDDSGVKYVAILRKTDNMTDELKYLNGFVKDNPDAWKFDGVTLTSESFDNGTRYYKMENGHKIWVLNSSKLTSDQNDLSGRVKDFEFKFDYATDFNIKTDCSGAKLTAQSFILCVIDQQGLSRTTQFVLKGDTDKPVLTLDKVVVYSSYTSENNNKDKKEYTLGDSRPELAPFRRDNSNNITDKIQLRGTWSDDSTYLKPITVNLQHYGNLTITKKADGTWYSTPITPSDKTSFSITAELEDLGGNKETKNAGFYVNGAIAQFLRISSDTENGHYTYFTQDKEDPTKPPVPTEIYIYLEFTKPVEFKGGTANPSLLLSNGKTAVYDSGNKTSYKHKFKYTVAEGDGTETSSVLNVTKIVTKGHKWYDGETVVWNSSGAAEIQGTAISSNLAVNRSIYVDTNKPSLTLVNGIISSETDDTIYFKQGTKLYFNGTFSEEMDEATINATNLKLQFNTGNTTSATTRTGTNTVQFTYEVQAGDNVDSLAVSQIVWGSTDNTKPKDIAGNIINTSATTSYTNISVISLDTSTPDDPTITLDTTLSGTGTKKVVYNKSNVKVTINFDSDETTGVKKYTTDYKPTGTNIWSDYTGPITLSNGTYNICAYQEDAAGNKSGYATPKAFIIDNGHILKSIKVDKPSDTYGKDQTFTFTVKFRNKINVTSPKLSLNVGSSVKDLTIADKTNTDTLTFTYTTAAGDSCPSKLTVNSLTGTFTDEYGNDINSFVTITGTGVELFETEKTIKIDTSTPQITGVTLDVTLDNQIYNQILKIAFDSVITKGTSGTVTLTMTDTYRAPPYFSKEKWADYSGDSTVSAYYESNAVGCSSTGTPDLTEKYVLKYDYDITNATLTAALKDLDADKAKMDINSSDVSVSADGKTLQMNFREKIPVKGATYKVTIPANLVYNSLSKGNAAKDTYSVTLAGVEDPVIRIKKTDEIIAQKGTTNPITAATSYTNIDVVQPVTAEARIDCQTPGSTIKYGTTVDVSKGVTMSANGNTVQLHYNNNTNVAITSAPSHNLADPDASTSYTDKSTFPLSAGTGNNQKGCQILIKAQASKSGSTATSTFYEKAMKTVIILTNRGEAGDYHFRCIRGGDQPQGAVSTPNFPFSWNTNEYSKIRTMTGSGNADGSSYYWISWKLSTTSYVGFLAAADEMPADANTNGPQNWWWASCGWVPDVANMPIYPGETTTCNANGVLTNKSGGFQFLAKHQQGR